MRKATLPAISFVLLILLGARSTLLAQAHFLRADANHDREVDVSDAVFTLFHLFLEAPQPPCLDALDVNDDGANDLSDVLSLLDYLFLHGASPAAPFPVFEADPTPDGLSCLPERPGSVSEGGSVITGDITEDVHLAADRTYRIISGAYVKQGAELTIDPGVTILGDSETTAFLAIERGARIFAVGTNTHPVVFTSDRPVGSREAGDWGGVLVCGRAPANVEGGEWVVKGFDDLWAGGGANPDPEESSGQLSYVRFEFAGGDVMGFPLTAITFCALGSGTQLDHILAKYGRDDGLEWYGGTSSLRYGLTIGVEDDGIDCEYGWQGRAQFLVCLQNPAAGNNGWQVAEDDEQPRLEPLTLPTLANLTLLGAYASGSRSADGIRVERWAGVEVHNSIVEGWHENGIRLDDDFGPVTITHTIFADNDDHCSGSNATCSRLFDGDAANTTSDEGVVVDAETLEDPDLRGIASRLPSPRDLTEIDEWFEPVTFVGAVPPEGEGDDWTRERWVSWQTE